MINFNTTKDELNQIENWLKNENDIYGKSFYSNRNIIEGAYNNNCFLSFNFNNEPVGFVVFSKGAEHFIGINIFCIKYEKRLNGLGKYYYYLLEEYFKSKGFLAIIALDVLEESIGFWESLKFISYKFLNNRKTLQYKPLIDTLLPNKNINGINILELWENESYTGYATLKWNTNEDGTLEKPILIPYDEDWTIRWTLNNEKIKEEKIKRFQSVNYDYYSYCGLLYIGFIDLNSSKYSWSGRDNYLSSIEKLNKNLLYSI